MYVWSWIAGRADTNNDINVLAVFPMVQEIFSGKLLFKIEDGYKIKGSRTTRRILYLLGDGNYDD